MLKQRVITAVILLSLFLLALFLLPTLGWAALVMILVMQGSLEWAHLSKLSKKSVHAYLWLTLAVMLGIVFLDTQYPGQLESLHMLIYGMSALLWLILVPLWLIAHWQVRQPLLMMPIGWMLLIPTGVAMMDLRMQNPWWLLGVMGLVWMADIAAYFSGRKFGKHKLAPNISPGKTWEGVFGALLGVTVYVLLIVCTNDLFTNYAALSGMLLASWGWVGLAVIGDLFESAIKRQAGVKDSGALLPGHGGLLDRIDALTSTLPLAALGILLQRVA
ncbi:Phosphatidate cytidylyltransferase [Candidatus Nitrotoga sp. BS]|uniref:phosphatidate cytidylyltransferase n=1 Tax=Candidatus Nitrotoga sp. BS TaxID=2890408 RepID=UPI001EF2FABC|nr:phosphatidate cytidylyltransferase [Candidatus Nitrotoga sp. BS]CAH1191591.1 Phosphatidate cytidylyltransferase [Candidatus Nitrotoga sp. BS]